jgi:hypothetical protein
MMNIVSNILQYQILTLHTVDAFVALGGSPTKEGTIEATVLIEIIKDEFELTIDMQVKKTGAYAFIGILRINR